MEVQTELVVGEMVRSCAGRAVTFAGIGANLAMLQAFEAWADAMTGDTGAIDRIEAAIDAFTATWVAPPIRCWNCCARKRARQQVNASGGYSTIAWPQTGPRMPARDTSSPVYTPLPPRRAR